MYSFVNSELIRMKRANAGPIALGMRTYAIDQITNFFLNVFKNVYFL